MRTGCSLQHCNKRPWKSNDRKINFPRSRKSRLHHLSIGPTQPAMQNHSGWIHAGSLNVDRRLLTCQQSEHHSRHRLHVDLAETRRTTSTRSISEAQSKHIPWIQVEFTPFCATRESKETLKSISEKEYASLDLKEASTGRNQGKSHTQNNGTVC